MTIKLLVFLLIWPCGLVAQSFSGLGSSADGFLKPLPEPIFDFPADHGPHPQYRIEWWYLTANLIDPYGAAYGIQWTLFRTALAPGEGDGWSSPQVWFAHAAVTSSDMHISTERLARGGIGQAGVEADPFRAWIDDWTLEGDDFDSLKLRATAPEFSYEMTLNADGPLVFHGETGYSQKSADGHASYYYSQPFFKINGVLRLPDREIQLSGEAWLDREWSSQPLAETQLGWDWFALSFQDGNKLMGFRLRQADGNTYSAATWIEPNGNTLTYPDGIFLAYPLQISEVAERTIPTKWRIMLPEKYVDIQVEALNKHAWMNLSIPYWEGPVYFEGSHEGHGYLEMTGYE